MPRMLKQWWRGDEANAAIEAGFLFPILVSLLLGMVDTGILLLTNQKVINSCHMIADLLAREQDITNAEFNDAVVAGELAIAPYSTTSMGYDVAGVQFIGVQKTPTVQWRDTFNMTANSEIIVGAANLGDQDEGVLAVTVVYTYQPLFTSIFTGDIYLEEISYARGRYGSFVTRTRS